MSQPAKYRSFMKHLLTEDHDAFRDVVQGFLKRRVTPNLDRWERDGRVPREILSEVGALGAYGVTLPLEHGGGGLSTFLFNAVWIEEVALAGVNVGGASVHMNVVLPYFRDLATGGQAARWFDGIGSGALMTAIAMTEPGAGSDLAGIKTRAVPAEGGWSITGGKTFITGANNADLIVVVARTSSEADSRKGLSLFVVERGSPGLYVGDPLEKIGLMAQDTAEVVLQDVFVPAENLLGMLGAGFEYLSANLAQERLTIAVNAVASTQAVLDLTVSYVKDREMFGTTLGKFQNTKFVLAQASADLSAAQALVAACVAKLESGNLTAADAARAKLHASELFGRVSDACLQFFGGYGYMREYPIARYFTDSRVFRIYGGTSEVMKVIIAKDLGL